MNTTPVIPLISARSIKTSAVMAVATALGTEIIQSVMGNDMATGTHDEKVGRSVISTIISKRIVANLEKSNV